MMPRYDMEMNKISAAVLLAGIIAMVCGLIAEGVYEGRGHDEEAKRGYTIAGAETAESGAAPAASEPAQPVDIAPFLAKADAEAGKAKIKLCTACHTFDKGGKNGVGPNQWGLIGGHIAHKEDYKYSDAVLAMKGKQWTFQELSDFLANPKKHIPGNKMSFAGMKDPQDRANLLAYLNTLTDTPLPLPK